MSIHKSLSQCSISTGCVVTNNIRQSEFFLGISSHVQVVSTKITNPKNIAHNPVVSKKIKSLPMADGGDLNHVMAIAHMVLQVWWANYHICT